MKNSSPAKPERRLDKQLFEAGQQCLKRLYLDAHEPVEPAADERRRSMSEVGQTLLRLARSAFPRGVDVAEGAPEEMADRTAELLRDGGTPILFGATFVTGRIGVQTDILLRQKDGQLDVYEVKSGTKVKQRYVTDLALQVHAIEAAGHRVRAAFVLHLDHRYRHKEGADYVPQQLFRSADVTERVRRSLPAVAEHVDRFHRQLDDESLLQVPTGTYCTNPFPCPHLARCSREEPEFPLRELPDLTRGQESEMHLEGIWDQLQLDPKRPGLTFRQRRALQAVQQRAPIVEPFVREELRQLDHPIHFLAVLDVVETLPRFDGQRPWRPLPYAFAIRTVHETGRVEEASFAHADRTDPRTVFIKQLAPLLANGGTIVCWCHERLTGVRAMLEDNPVDKPAIRIVLGRPHLDMKRLFDSGVFHPEQHDQRCLPGTARVLLGDRSIEELSVRDDESAFLALQKAFTPRIRSATKDKIATDLRAFVEWQVRMIAELYQRFGEVERKAVQPQQPRTAGPRKQLPPV